MDLTTFEIVRLIALGLTAGFIDSIAGGGGLITIPALALVLGLNAATIGTNKIGATAATLVALYVYLKKGHFNLKKGIYFAVFIAAGSFLGSQATQFIPNEIYKYFLMFSAPLILWLIFNKKLWLNTSHEPQDLNLKKQRVLLAGCGIVVGFYDGLWGPGGGTFMLLSLLFVTKIPLMGAIAISKFANLTSALSSLTGYAISDQVVWKVGLLFAIPVSVGALIGASLASQKAEKIVRPILLVVVALLMIKVYLDN